MITVLIAAGILVFLAFLGLGVSLLFHRENFYNKTSIERNPHMKKRGIVCAKNEELRCYSPLHDCNGCSCWPK